ncbi:MAG TPA: type II toxin-antitoxin system VapC family toxin [Thermoplasmata archaeon]|nr:type II toxin-antitoxin system VapC family toxin [Thermoplasmata archaeon]
MDSYGWIERLTDGPLAGEYNRVMESVAPNEIVTSVVSIYEVYRKLRSVKGEADALSGVAALKATHVAPVDERIALEAADFSLTLKLHFSDALIYATARRYDAVLHTTDPDLKGAPSVVYHSR